MIQHDQASIEQQKMQQHITALYTMLQGSLFQNYQSQYHNCLHTIRQYFETPFKEPTQQSLYYDDSGLSLPGHMACYALAVGLPRVSKHALNRASRLPL